MPDRNPFVITGSTEHLLSLKIVLLDAPTGHFGEIKVKKLKPAIKALLEAIDKGIERNKDEEKDIIKYHKP